MTHQFETWLNTRMNFIKLIDDLPPAMTNIIPIGFNNNIIWNFTHALATQQNFFYVLSGLQPVIPSKYFHPYLKGTSPTTGVDGQQLNEIKDLALSTVEQGRKDYENGLFYQFKKYKTGYGVELHTIEDAIAFNPVHEAVHMGYAKAIKRIINI